MEERTSDTQVKRLRAEIDLLRSEVARHREREKDLEDSRRAMLYILEDVNETSSGLEKAKDELQKSERRYRHLIESVTDYIYTVQVEDGRPLETTHGEGCVAVTGYTPEEYAADSGLWYRMIYDEDRKTVAEQVERVMAGETVPYIEHRMFHKDGSVRWVKNTLVPRYDVTGSLIAYDGLISDITERKRLEEQLRHAQKMEAIGTLAGGVAHDFNNILNVILGYGTMVRDRFPDDPVFREEINEILAAAERGANLTRRLLAFSRKQVADKKLINVDDIVVGMEKMLSRIIGGDIILTLSLCGREQIVKADTGQIEQVLMNLASNARDAMPGGGVLTISTAIVEIDDGYIVGHGYGRRGSYAMISVSDTGKGMDVETQKKIFEPFFTTKGVGEGTGLGLSIAYGIMKQHDGFIEVMSDEGKGTTFRILLPLVEGAIPEERKTEAAPAIGGTETILIAEDDAASRRLLKIVLESVGYRVIAAEDGEEAMDKFRANSEQIRLTILDMVMPGKNGKEVYEEIRKLRPEARIMFASGYTIDTMTNRELIEEGMDIIFKPAAQQELLKKVREVLDR